MGTISHYAENWTFNSEVIMGTRIMSFFEFYSKIKFHCNFCKSRNKSWNLIGKKLIQNDFEVKKKFVKYTDTKRKI